MWFRSTVTETLLAHFRYIILAHLHNFAPGTRVFIASSAEYTPPVIYSRDDRSKLVYLIEARPSEPDKFRVGQPVTVTLMDGAGQ